MPHIQIQICVLVQKCASNSDLLYNISITIPVPLIAQRAGETVDLAEAVVEAKVRHVVGGERKIRHVELVLHLEKLLHSLRVLLVLLQDARGVEVHRYDPVEERGICVKAYLRRDYQDFEKMSKVGGELSKLAQMIFFSFQVFWVFYNLWMAKKSCFRPDF